MRWGFVVPGRAPHRQAGFTLLELLIVLAIVAILVALAVPAYRGYVERVNRAEAARALLAVAACQERLRAAEGWYRPQRCLEGVEAAGYRFEIEPADVERSADFTAIATPTGEAGSNRCGGLSLDHTGRRGVSAENASVADCWGGR